MPRPHSGTGRVVMVRLRQNVLYNITGQGLVLVLSLVAVRLLFVRLGGDVFGIIFFILVLSPLVVFALDLGLSSTIIREISQHHEQDPAYVEALVRTAGAVYWTGYLLAVLVLLVIAPLLVSHWVHLSTLDDRSAATLLRILGAGAVTALLRGFYGAVIRGLQQMKYSNLIDVSMAAAQQAGAALLIVLGAGALAVVAWLACCFVLGTAAYALVVGRFLGWRAIVPGWSGVVIERNHGFSARVFAVSLLSMASLQVDKLFVSKLLPISIFGFYSFAGSLAYRAVFASVAITLATLPALSSLLASGDHAEASRQYRRLQDLQCLFAVPVLALVLYAEAPLATYTFNRQVAQDLMTPLVVLCLGFFLQIAIATPMTLLIASGAPGLVARSSLAGLAAGTSVGLPMALSFGMTGAALYYLVYNVIMCWYLVSRSARPLLCVAPRSWYRHAGRILLPGAAIYGAPLALALRFEPSTALLAVLYVLASAAFGLIGYHHLMGPELRSSMAGMSRQVWLRLSRLQA